MMHMPRWKVFLILAVSLIGIILAIPNILPQKIRESLPSWLPSNTVVLGLDLQGGSHLLLEVDMKTVMHDMMVSKADAIRDILRKQKIGYKGIAAKGEQVIFQLRNPEDFKKVEIHLKVDPTLVPSDQGNGTVAVRLTAESIVERKRSAVEQSLEIVRRRVDETGTREPIIQRQGDDRIILQLPGVDDPEHVKALLGKTAKMAFRLVDMDHEVSDAMAGRIPPDSELLEMTDRDDGTGSHEERENPKILVKKKVAVSGENLVDAKVGVHHETGAPVVNFGLDSVGSRKFADVTRDNVGKAFAIVLDNQVISAPRINGPISGGGVMIEGGFTVKTANDLALLLRAGALPAPLTVLEQRTVGPDLGADSIKSGQRATIYAVILVALFMILAYMFFGVIANVALIVNIIWLMGAMSALQATLTLPGIAGIALTLGMAVDANVLIYERIKEELRNGMKAMSAIEAGYKRAMATVTDSNLTTLIGAGVLYIFGTGPVKGFAVTLALGIAISMFTAISLTRLIIIYWYKWRRPKTLSI